jgi:predicted transcriptional regulator
MANELKEFRQWRAIKSGVAFTQRMLADESGYSLSYIRRMEQGQKPVSRGLRLWINAVMKKK